MRIETSWVRPAPSKNGLDHLAVQAPCVALYGQLIPGITNVTDRARYYTFYPWLLWNLEKRRAQGLTLKFHHVLRRAECLFALIAERHARVLEEPDWLHGIRMVGRDKLVRALQQDLLSEGWIDLNTYATREEGPKRYFKNPLGGLGQYYLGPMRDLGLLLGNSTSGLGYSLERGQPLAEAMEQGVDSDAFFVALEAGEIHEATLDGLSSFCPCHLPASTAECRALLDVLFDRQNTPGGEGWWRRNSLALMLDIVAQRDSSVDESVEQLFRAACYAGSVDNTGVWSLSSGLEQARRGWAIYQRNELLSIALQGLFWVTLQRVQQETRGRAASVEELARQTREFAATVLGQAGARLFSESVQDARSTLPALTHWRDPRHEQGRAWALFAAARQGNLEEVLRASTDILVALAAREEDTENPYRDFTLTEDYFRDYALNLRSFSTFARGEWSSQSLSELCGWWASRWGVETHWRVALRKLHYDSQDTFLIRPMDGWLQVVNPEGALPVFTSPRLRTSLRMLGDLGLLRYDDKGEPSLSAPGRVLLGSLHD